MAIWMITAWARLKTWLVAIGAAIAAIIGVYFYGRRSGSLDEMQRQTKEDQDNARKIEDAADKARFDRVDTLDNAIEQLRHSKKLRD